MTALYLWLNSGLYGVLALWCSIDWSGTSNRLGFTSLSPSGKSEFLTIYGGLQLGLAAFFGYSAWKPMLRESGLLFALLLYAGIVAYRVSTIFAFGPLSYTTKAVAALEIALLAGATWLLFSRKS